MTAGNLPRETNGGLDEDAVVAYLRKNPDFLERRPELIGELRVPHSPGAAISLVEYQLNALRQEGREMRSRIDRLVENARDNEDLGRKVHALTLELVACGCAGDVFGTLYQCLSAQFSAELSVVRVFAAPRDPADAGLAEFDVSDRELFAAALEGQKPVCGRLRAEQVAVLFGVEPERVGSAALVPLGGQRAFGLLAVASHDAQRYHPGMGTVFLRQLGELLAVVLAGHVAR